jgi:hypothetical protein
LNKLPSEKKDIEKKPHWKEGGKESNKLPSEKKDMEKKPY